MFRNNGTPTEHQVLPSIQGHDSFLVDYERFGPAVGEFMDRID